MNIDHNLISSRIRELRREKGLTQAQLAEHAGLSSQYICQIESGKKKASLSTLVSISESLELPLDIFMAGNRQDVNKEYVHEMSMLLTDCDMYERRMIYEMARTLKSSIRKNKAMLNDDSSKIVID